MDQFTYTGKKISSTESEVNLRLLKVWIAVDRLLAVGQSDLSDKIKREFFQAVAASVLLYSCITWTLAKPLENCTRVLRAVLKKSWNQRPTRQLLSGYLLAFIIFKKDKQDVLRRIEEERMYSSVMFSYGFWHIY